MKKRKRPRQFQYLDQQIAESYYSDLMGGLPEGGSTTERYSDSAQKDRRLGWKGSGLGRTEGTEESSEDRENFRLTPEGIFKRLHNELDRETEEGKILIYLDALNGEGWNELEDGDIVQITGTIKIPEVLKAMEAAKGMEQFLPYLDLLGDISGEDLDIGGNEKAMISGLSGFGQAIDSQDSTILIVELSKSPRYRFVAKIKKECLKVNTADLEGEAKVVGTINRKINKGDPPIGLEQLIPEFGSIRELQNTPTPPANRADRRAAKKGKGKETEEDPFSVGFPAATLTPIGIFR